MKIPCYFTSLSIEMITYLIWFVSYVQNKHKSISGWLLNLVLLKLNNLILELSKPAPTILGLKIEIITLSSVLILGFIKLILKFYE